MKSDTTKRLTTSRPEEEDDQTPETEALPILQYLFSTTLNSLRPQIQCKLTKLSHFIILFLTFPLYDRFPYSNNGGNEYNPNYGGFPGLPNPAANWTTAADYANADEVSTTSQFEPRQTAPDLASLNGAGNAGTGSAGGGGGGGGGGGNSSSGDGTNDQTTVSISTGSCSTRTVPQNTSLFSLRSYCTCDNS